MVLTFLVLAGVLIIFGGAYAQKLQGATLWIGKKIAPFGADKELPRGYQDAITPKFQTALNISIFISYGALLIIGSMQRWYLGIFYLILSLFLMTIVANFFPKRLNFYFDTILQGMFRKTADYIKSGDSMRAEVAKEVTEKLTNFYITIKEKNLDVPTMDEARSATLGDVFNEMDTTSKT